VALKALMAVTGLCLVAFLLMHMIGNLKMFLGEGEFNHYAEFLKQDVLYPIIPHGVFIWLFRFGLLAFILLHMFSAVTLWHRAAKATPTKYETRKRLSQSYASRTMRWGGVILALGLIWHLIQFTVAPSHGSPFVAVKTAFQNPAWVGVYLLWIGVVCVHIRHGFWSAFATLGINTSALAKTVLNCLAYLVAGLIFLGFAVVPIAILAGGIQ
jgi:succinate dehydrogenase / fumarate reductase cytochrome b subunit